MWMKQHGHTKFIHIINTILMSDYDNKFNHYMHTGKLSKYFENGNDATGEVDEYSDTQE